MCIYIYIYIYRERERCMYDAVRGAEAVPGHGRLVRQPAGQIYL